MHRRAYFVNAVLWATAILASAIMGASPFLTAVLLPSLAATALMLSRPSPAAPSCPSPTIEAD